METVGHASVTQQLQLTGGCRPGLEDRKAGKQKNWKVKDEDRGQWE